MREILPGVQHWTTVHPGHGFPVSGYALVAEGVLLDALVPDDGIQALAGPPAPTDVLLTNRLHWRGGSALIETFGVRVHVPRAGLHDYGADRPVMPYDPGDTLPGGIVAYEVGHLCPDEMALWIPAHRALAIADGIVRHPPEGPLGMVPGMMIGEDPEPVRAGLRARYAELADALEPEHLLLAHGAPWIGGGAQALRAFARDGASITL